MKEETNNNKSSRRFGGIIVTFLSMVIALVVIFMAQMVLNIQSEVGEIKAALQALNAQVVATRHVEPKMVVEPFAVLEENCARCHNEYRLTRMHKSSFDVQQIIHSMESHPDLTVSSQKEQQIHASLLLLRCNRCHTEEQISRFGTLTDGERQMVAKWKTVHAQGGIFRQDMEETLRIYAAALRAE